MLPCDSFVFLLLYGLLLFQLSEHLIEVFLLLFLYGFQVLDLTICISYLTVEKILELVASILILLVILPERTLFSDQLLPDFIMVFDRVV